MTRQATDQLYIEIGYYAPEEYYVYIAEAQAQPSAAFSVTVIGSELTDATVSASSNASVSAQVDRIRDADSALSSQSTQTALVGKILEVSADFGALFTPSIDAQIVLNQTATLDSVSTLSADVQANRSASITLDTIGNLNSQADKFVGYDSQMSSAFAQSADINYIAENQITATATATQTATVNYQVEGIATVSSQFTQTTSATYLDLAQAALIARSSLFASRNVGTGRPRTFTTNGTVSFTTGSKFGSHALSCGAGSNFAIASASRDYNRWRTIDFWYNATAPGGGGGRTLLATDNWTLWHSEQASPGGYRINFQSQEGDFPIAWTGVLSTTGYIHVRLIRENSAPYYTLYLNGNKITWSRNDFTNSNITATNQTLKIGNSFSTTNTVIIDELIVSTSLFNNSGASTITVPTAPWALTDQSNVVVLSHFNNILDDDVSITQTGAASLSSSATLSAQAVTIKLANVNLTSVLSLPEALVTKLTGVGSDLSSSFTTDISATRIKEFSSDQTSAFSQNTVIDKIVEFASDQSAETTLSADGTRIIQFNIALTDAFTPVVNVNAQLAGVALLETAATLSADINAVFDHSSNVTSTAGLTAILSHTISFAANITAQFTSTTDAERVRFFDSAIASASTVSTTGTRLRLIGSTQVAESSVTATVFRTKSFESAVTAVVTTNQSISVLRSANADMQAQCAQTLINFRVRTTGSEQTSEFTQTTTAVKTPGINVNISANFAQTTSAVKRVDAVPQLESIATQLSVAMKNATGTITLESSFAVSASVGRLLVLDSTNSLASTGVQIYDMAEARLGPQGTGIFTRNYVLDRNATISFWARRNLNSYLNDPQIIFGTEFELANNTRLLFNYTYNNSLNRFENTISWDYFAGGGAASWIFATSIDNEWHHFLLRMNNNSTGGTAFRFWDLWVDGVYIGEQRNSTLNNTPRISGDYLALGYSIPFGPDPDPSRFDGSLAQLWIGDTNPTFGYTFAPQDFYQNGPADLGVDGTANGKLVDPAIYNQLTDPWTAVNFTNYGILNKSAPEPLTYQGLRGSFSIEVTANQRIVFRGDLFSTSTLSAQAFKIIDNPAALTATATLTVSAKHIKALASTQSASFAVQTQAGNIHGGHADIAVQADFDIVPGFVKQYTSQLQEHFQLEVDVLQILPIRTEADLLADFNLSADINVFTEFAIALSANTTVACEFDVIPPTRGSADLQSQFTLTATIGSIEQFAVLVASAGSLSVSIGRIRNASAVITAQAIESSIIGKITGLVATNLTCQGFQLTAGDVINLDPALTYIVPQEHRTLIVKPESREYLIESETRIYKLLKG